MALSIAEALAMAKGAMLPQTGPYFRLPREIRDLVMEFALHPGNIYIRTDRKAPLAEDRRYGSQLLATCRQAYEEGYRPYYGGNTFHLGPCSYSTMKRVILNYEKHLPTIHHLVVHCTVHDTSLSRIRTIKALVDQAVAAQNDGSQGPAHYESRRQRVYAITISHAIRAGWARRATCFRDHVLGGFMMRVVARPPVSGSAAAVEDRFWGLTIECGPTSEGETGRETEKEVIMKAAFQLTKQLVTEGTVDAGLEL